MTWLIWAKEILEFIGALSVAGVILGKIIEFLYKLYKIVSTAKVRVDEKGELSEVEKAFYERDE